jgi:hypothetical protein
MRSSNRLEAMGHGIIIALTEKSDHNHRSDVADESRGRVQDTGVSREKKTMEGFLFYSGSLALILGCVALIEGNLYRFNFSRRRKGHPSIIH